MKTTAISNRAPEEMASAEGYRQEDWQMPAVDIAEDFDKIQVIASMPGVLQEDINVTYERDVLKIRGRVRQPENPSGRYLLREFNPAGYERTFRINEHIDRDRIAADYAHGVLTLTLPKSEAAKPRTIPVNVV